MSLHTHVSRTLIRDGRRRATGLVRTLVIAASTLAILLVCFSIYQYSRLDPTEAALLPHPRLPDLPSAPAAINDVEDARSTPGVDIGRAVVGPGERIQMTFYPPGRGDRPWMAVNVRQLTPIKDEANAFLLTDPDMRMRTRNGHAIRVTAERATVEAQRRPGGGFDPRRGTLEGSVLIQYDRLSEEQRAALPPARGNTVHPDDLVQIEMERMEFDVDYSKVIVPGALHLFGRDVDLQAGDVEIQFNEIEDRVESLRIGQAGRLTLLEAARRLGIRGPGDDSGESQRQSVVDWLRETLQARFAPPDARPQVEPPEAPQSEAAASRSVPLLTYTPDGVPVFLPPGEAPIEETDEPPPKYYARLEGDVTAVQDEGESPRGRLSADVLELIRAYRAEDRPAESATDEQAKREQGAAVSDSPGRIVLRWHDRLIVEPCEAEDSRCPAEAQAWVRASGSPVRLTSSDFDAACAKLDYSPEETKSWLHGSQDAPARVRFGQQGVVRGVEIFSQRDGDDLIVRVAGPGVFARGDRQVQAPAVWNADVSQQNGIIRFDEKLEAFGRMVTRTQLNFTGYITTSKERVIDRATFTGRVRAEQGQTTLQADSVSAFFAGAAARAGRQAIERVHAVGHVVMKQERDDEVRCREMELTFATDAAGRETPRFAVLRGDVAVKEGARTIQARDRLLVDFARIDRGAFADGRHEQPALVESDVSKTDAKTKESGADTRATADSLSDAERRSGSRVVIERFRAFGEVAVHDGTEELEIEAETLDCSIHDGRQIEEAVILGTDDRPASVRLNDLTVISSRLNVHAPDQWVEAPDAGRLTLLSRKDLGGERLAQPVPIVVNWAGRMTFSGRENRAVFVDDVHATSRAATTFDCQRLEVEFDRVQEPASPAEDADWWVFEPLVKRVFQIAGEADRLGTSGARARSDGYRREPARIYATGNVVAVSAESDPETGQLLSRARIAGPMLSVNLRPDVSKAVIQGAGDLLIEDYRPDRPAKETQPSQPAGLFAVERSGPSITLIQWADLMWYDFAIDQTQFDGQVRLTHFSGPELDRIRGAAAGSAEPHDGRATFLSCNRLKVDFLDASGRATPPQDRALGGLSADRLQQFQASGSVVLQDENEGLAVTADQIIYWRDRNLLAVHGTPSRKAHIVRSKPAQLPDQVSVERAFYNLSTGEMELLRPRLRGR